MNRYAVPLALFPLLGLACGDDTSPASPDATTGAGATNDGGQGVGATGGAGATGIGGTGGLGGDGGAGTGGTGGNPPGCHETPGPEDALRRVVIARPYNEQGGPAPEYEVFELDSDGVLTETGTFFTMGRAGEGEIAFTPDGQIGIAVHDNGTLGVFRLDQDGQPAVVHASFSGSFYATRVWIAPTGDRALVLDLNFPANGGGIYEVSIACDGTLTDEGMLATTKLARRMTPLHDGSGLAVLAASTFETSPVGADAHLLDLADLSSLGSADAFGDDDAIVAALDVTHDGAFALIGDNSGFSSVPNRVAVVSVGATGLAPVQTLPNVEDPVDIVTSPFDDAAIVVSAFGDAIFELAYDPTAGSPFTMLGELDYVGGGPQLPVDAVMIERGALRGHVLITEVTGIRQLQFSAGGVADEGRLEFGEGLDQLVGAIGVQP